MQKQKKERNWKLENMLQDIEIAGKHAKALIHWQGEIGDYSPADAELADLQAAMAAGAEALLSKQSALIVAIDYD